LEESEEYFKISVSLNHENSVLLANLGNVPINNFFVCCFHLFLKVLFARKQIEESLNILGKAISLDPENTAALFTRASALVEKKNFKVLSFTRTK